MSFEIGNESWRYEIRASWRCERGLYPFAWARTAEQAEVMADELRTWKDVDPRSVRVIDKQPQLNGVSHS